MSDLLSLVKGALPAGGPKDEEACSVEGHAAVDDPGALLEGLSDLGADYRVAGRLEG